MQNDCDTLFLVRGQTRLLMAFLVLAFREHGVVGDMRDVWPNARSRKNVSLIRTYHGFKGNKFANSILLYDLIANDIIQ